ncbi:MAG: uncharacterized LabA/DUF88 family protein [Acidimicrobiales bacterium]|jgi:uncharacterized LabA/DUF88 family protein
MGVIKHPDQRVAIIIDTQNLYHSAKNLYKAKVNFANVVKEALGGRKLIRAISYVVNTESGEEQPFFEAMEKVGIEIKTKDLQIFYGGAKKADWDVGMVVDAIKLSHKVDAIVFATGDGDFIPGVEYIKSRGCQVEGITFGRSASSAFKVAVDDFIDMDEDPATFLLGYRAPRGHNKKKSEPKKSVATPTKKVNTTKKQGNSKLKKQIQRITTTGSDTDDMN